MRSMDGNDQVVKNVLSKPWNLREEFINEEWGRVMGAMKEERKKEKKRRKDGQTPRRKEKELEKAAREKKRKGKAVEESARCNRVGAEVAATEVGYRYRGASSTGESDYGGTGHEFCTEVPQAEPATLNLCVTYKTYALYLRR